jgi:hypothetical protein
VSWSPLGTQFCLELGFGVLFTLFFVARAPLGTFFFRMLGTTALIPIFVAVMMPLSAHQMRFADPIVWCAALAVVSYPLYSGPISARKRRIALAVAALGCAAALALHVRALPTASGGAPWLVVSLSALATGCVGGSVGLAMVFGHWYLTVPALDVEYLVRLNRLTMLCMLASIAALTLSCLVFADQVTSARSPLFAPWGMFHFGTRVAVGLLMPLLFGWMTAQSLQFKNTRSATGILYASTVLVLIGTAVSVSLQDTYGIPL